MGLTQKQLSGTRQPTECPSRSKARAPDIVRTMGVLGELRQGDIGTLSRLAVLEVPMQGARLFSQRDMPTNRGQLFDGSFEDFTNRAAHFLGGRGVRNIGRHLGNAVRELDFGHEERLGLP